MNKIYYVLYIVKTLYHLLHVALPRKGVFIASLEVTMVLQRGSRVGAVGMQGSSFR